jgi:hypothetical protein
MTRHLFAPAIAAAISSIAPAQVPSRFSASIDNFSSHTYTVELRDEKLLYSDATPNTTAKPIVITPSHKQWREFRRALDTIDVWKWRDSYMPDEVIFDGTSWTLAVSYPDCSVISRGANSYPDARKDMVQLSVFRQLEAAIEALLGGRSFRTADHAPKQ